MERAASPPDCICACPRRSSSSPRRGLVGLGQQVEGAQGRVEEVGGALVGQRGQRLVPGALGMLERLGRIADRRRLDEVVGQLGLARGGALERLAHGGVQPGAAGGGEVAVERLADEAVGEAERAGRPRRLLEQLHGERLVEALEEVGAVDARPPARRVVSWKSRPSTAATSSASRTSGRSGSRRRRIASRTPSGSGTRSPSGWSMRPWATSRRTTSSE